ncbi:MAG: LysM peptidoglycan-binding domain-containing protein [Chlorobi bacterium]|nr:LysM peptidoglycan-binding domain-containing protein [Chlorobiota bacterium]
MKQFIAGIFFIFIALPSWSNPTGRLTYEQYINKYKDLAIKEMKRTGIPASITMAQALLESNAGNSTLARKSNNHFGIKCHNDWKGKKVYYDDDRRNECFRKYKTVYDSYIDHSNFLVNKKRYASLFKLKPTDYKGWAHGLKKAGYATDPRYAHRLIKLIEDYKLYELDRKGSKVRYDYSDNNNTTVAEDSGNSENSDNTDNFVVNPYPSHEVKYNNNVKYIDVEPGDTFESISEEFGLRPWEIYHYNDIPENADISKFRHLYIEPKRRKAARQHEYHIVKQGETLQRISHKYGIKLKRLLKLNNLNGSENIKPGTKLYLRHKKK